MQFVGMGSSVFSNFFGHFILNIWYGAAYISPIGFILGLLWHIQAIPSGYSSNRPIIILLGLLSIIIPIFGYFSYDTLRFALSQQMKF
jgi:hypothetical protein